MTTETFFANFGHLADAPNGVQKLRELILQLAVQGKLVPQDPSNEPASVLLERIEAEKNKLITAKEIRDKKIGSLDDAPYDLPDNWSWVPIGNICRDWGQKVPDKRFSYIDVSAIDNERGVVAEPVVTEAANAPSRARKLVRPGTVIYSTVRPYLLNIAVIDKMLDPEPIASTAFAIIHPLGDVSSQYIFWFLRSPVFISYVESKMLGVAYPAINDSQFFSGLFPLPPLEEQKRIVTKVDQLMTLCNELEARQQKQQQGRVRLNNSALDALLTAREPDEFADHWQRISTNFDLLYDHPETIAKLRAAILQLAVQGKLVPQDPTDEPASALLARIKVEKERLVKEGKLKKQKSLPIINEDLAPFTLPNGWSWASFPDVGEFGRGKSKHRPRNDRSLYVGGTYPMVQTGDVARANGEIKTYTALYNDVGLAQSRLWPKGTMCITIAANIADSSILGFDACFPDSVVGLIVSKQISNVRYFEYFIRTAKEHLMNFAPSTAQKNINLGILETVLIPLPPLAEIDRIVAKVDQLMALCDELEAKLNQVQQHSEKLMEATVRQLLGTSTPQNPHTARAPAAPAASKSVRPACHAYQPAPAIAEPIAAETAVSSGGSVPETILAAMQPGQEYSRAAILAATSIREADWMWAIKELKEQRRVAQSGEKRGARYRLK
jgi:type I restriction enzyme S subunit